MKVQSMAERKRRHQAHVKAGNLNKAAQLRIRTRAFCMSHSLAVPKWAETAPRKQAPTLEPARVEAAPVKPVPPPTRALTPGVPLELPRVVREWRSSAGDRAVSIASDGTVTLMRGTREGKVKAKFPSLAAAAAALEPAIAWESVHVATPKWASYAARGGRATAAARNASLEA